MGHFFLPHGRASSTGFCCVRDVTNKPPLGSAAPATLRGQGVGSRAPSGVCLVHVLASHRG